MLFRSLAKDARNRGARLTVGRLDVHPNSITTIPGRVRFTIDVRDVDSDRQRRLAVEIVRRTRVLCDRRGIEVETELIADTSPVVLPIWIREQSAKVCEELGIKYRVMTSGAGHDSVYVSRVAPTGMVFIPCEHGVSHNESERATPGDVEAGANVLLQAMLEAAGVAA